MIDQIFYKYSTKQIHFTEDIYDFATTPDNQYSVLFYPCSGYQNVLPEVESSQWLYKYGEFLLIVRDLEQTPCFTELKAQSENICTNLPLFPFTRLLFSKPEFEQVYFSDLSLFKQVFIRLYKDTHKRPMPDANVLDTKISNLNINRPQASIKDLFKAYNMAYKKPLVARKFFGQFDFVNSTYPFIQRLLASLQEFI